MLREVADQMQSLGLTDYKSALVWMIHCSQTRVTEAELRDFAQYGGAIAPEKVHLSQLCSTCRAPACSAHIACVDYGSCCASCSLS